MTERLLKSLRRQPRPGAAFDRLLQQLEQTGAVEEFTSELRSELQTAPADNDGSTAVILGLLEFRSRHFESARSLFQTASQQRPSDPVVFWLLGSAALELGDAAAAVEACENALARKPTPTDLPGIARDLSAAFRRAGRAAEVPALWTRIEAADPDNLRLCEQAATALREARLPEQALIRYQRLATELDDPCAEPRHDSPPPISNVSSDRHSRHWLTKSHCWMNWTPTAGRLARFSIASKTPCCRPVNRTSCSRFSIAGWNALAISRTCSSESFDCCEFRIVPPMPCSSSNSS
ncbi:MAG UNVERIFIED_CONTAM: hypothetical protein LVR18_29665 [Planctomycetaceae bacterium]